MNTMGGGEYDGADDETKGGEEEDVAPLGNEHYSIMVKILMVRMAMRIWRRMRRCEKRWIRGMNEEDRQDYYDTDDDDKYLVGEEEEDIDHGDEDHWWGI